MLQFIRDHYVALGAMLFIFIANEIAYSPEPEEWIGHSPWIVFYGWQRRAAKGMIQAAVDSKRGGPTVQLGGTTQNVSVAAPEK